MNTFRVNYIDGKDHRYKSFETSVQTESEAVADLNGLYETDCVHKIVEVLKVDADPGRRMRIGSLLGVSPALD